MVKVVDLMKLEPSSEHPNGLSDEDDDTLTDTNVHARGYNAGGTITAPFDMRVQNGLDRSTWSKPCEDWRWGGLG